MTSIQGNVTRIGICVLLLSFTCAAPQARSSAAKERSVARDGQHDSILRSVRGKRILSAFHTRVR